MLKKNKKPSEQRTQPRGAPPLFPTGRVPTAAQESNPSMLTTHDVMKRLDELDQRFDMFDHYQWFCIKCGQGGTACDEACSHCGWKRPAKKPGARQW